MPRANSTQVVVPSLEEASPAYARMVEKRTELQGRLAGIERQLADMAGGLIPADLVAEDRALAMIGDVVPDTQGRPSVPRAALDQRRAELRREAQDVARALAILERNIIDSAREASRLVCESIRPDYEAAMRHLAQSLVETFEAHRSCMRIIDQFEVYDVRWTGFLPQPTSLRQFLGTIKPEYAVSQFLQDLVTAGLINKSTLKGVIE